MSGAARFAPKDMRELIEAVGALQAQVAELQRQASKPVPQMLPGFDSTWPEVPPAPSPVRQRVFRVERWSDPMGLRRQQYEVLAPFIPIGEANAVSADAIGRMSGLGSRVAKCLCNVTARKQGNLRRKPTGPGTVSHVNPWLYWREQ